MSMQTQGPLGGRVAVITGASSGIGAATAERLAALGAYVILAARRTERLLAICRRLGSTVSEAHSLDVTDADGCRRFADLVLSKQQSIDIVVNNAGLARGLANVVDSEERDWREMIEANVMGLMRMTQLFLPRLIEQRAGDLVHVGSVAGLQAYPQGAAYCATKAAVESFVRALRVELLGTGVRQFVIEPGMVETEFSQVRFHGDARRAGAVYQGVEPLNAGDVADCIVFAVTRPAHVCVQNMLVMPTAQATARDVARSSE